MTVRPIINWILGHEANTGWAYRNNYERLSRSLSKFNHTLDSTTFADVAIYFDVLIARKYPTSSRKAIVRAGGPRPLDVVAGGNEKRLQLELEKFDHVIALSSALAQRVSRIHPRVTVIPNGIDLRHWTPSSLHSSPNRPFTAGFAASVSSVKRDAKGFDLAAEAARRADVPLLQRHKGTQQVAHERMIEEFYSLIDILIHPSIAEGSSNVIMEALALGIPVVTTNAAGFHGERLHDKIDALIRPRSVDSIAGAVRLIQTQESLRRQISRGARLFAKRHHSMSVVASAYERVILETL